MKKSFTSVYPSNSELVTIDLNSLGSIEIPFFKGMNQWLLDEIIFFNASTNLSLSPFAASIWTGSGMTGTQLVAATSVVTMINGNVVVQQSLTPEAISNIQTSQSIFIEKTVVHGAPATLEVMVITKALK